MVIRPLHGSLKRTVAWISAGMLLALSACTSEAESTPPPYEAAFFDKNNAICEQMTTAVPDVFFGEFDARDIEQDFSGIAWGCSWRAPLDEAMHRSGILVDTTVHEGSDWQTEAQDWFSSMTNGGYRTVGGLGDAAIFAFPGRVSGAVQGLELWVLEGNVELRVLVEAYTDTDQTSSTAPWYHRIPFTVLQETALAMAESFLSEIGADQAEAVEPQPWLEGEYTELPDLCSGLEIDGHAIAADQNEWGTVGPTLNNCHWSGSTDSDADLWLSAEALSPPAVPEASATDLAAWWTGQLSATGGQELSTGDEAYLIALDPDAAEDDDIDRPGVDFAIRIGNVVLQGRYSTDAGETGTTAEVLVEQIGAQTEELLRGA